MEDKFLKEMLQKCAGPMPFSDFEDELMRHIQVYEKRRHLMRRNLRFSWFFFTLGMVSGMLLLAILPEWQEFSGGIDAGNMVRSFMVIGCFLLFFLFARNLLNMTNRYKS